MLTDDAARRIRDIHRHPRLACAQARAAGILAAGCAPASRPAIGAGAAGRDDRPDAGGMALGGRAPSPIAADMPR